MTQKRKKELKDLIIFMDLKILEAQGTITTAGIATLALYPFNPDWEDNEKRHKAICEFLEELK